MSKVESEKFKLSIEIVNNLKQMNIEDIYGTLEEFEMQHGKVDDDVHTFISTCIGLALDAKCRALKCCMGC